MFQAETHSLKTGQRFRFEEGGESYLVYGTGIIDCESYDTVFYRADDGLHNHNRDHTPVWIE